MLLKQPMHRTAPRRGVILMVVLAMLTLFAIVGITFVLFADATAMSARISREAETQIRPDMEPELALSYFLGQMIYDVHDDASGVQSALRGHSFARSMYGANFTAAGANWTGDNTLPYSGLGRFHTSVAPYATFPGTDEFNLVNYLFNAKDNLVRDPEHLGTRASTAAAYAANSYLSGNPAYTYCDGNNMFMAFMDTSTGEIKVPSFHRPWMGFGSLDPSNPNWTSTADPSMKYQVMCPRQAEHPNFPKTLDAGGHVKNLDWAPGGCDSIWIDIGAPVQTMADGRKFKMLVAPLILDLDGRLNLNVAGNVLGLKNGHASNQGWGAWEMNPSKVLNSTVSPNEWQNLFLGSAYPSNQTAILATNDYGRYGANGTPDGTAPVGGTFLHNYAPIDFNGIVDNGQAGYQNATSPYLLSGIGGNPNKPWSSFPYFPATGFGNGVPTETTPYHPSTYNPLRASGASGDDDRRFSVQGLHALLRFGGSGSEFVTTDLRLLAQNLYLDPAAATLKRRLQTTPISMDLDRPGVLPYIWDSNDQTTQANRYRFNSATTPPHPAGNALSFPTLTSRNATPPNSEFDPNTWRALSAALGRVNLNRTLSSYPLFNAGNPPVAFDLSNPNSATSLQYSAAISDRQGLASDIFTALRQATGALDATTLWKAGYTSTSPEYQATRYLAQLAVNIVDYIDEDDYMTPFQWDTTGQNTINGDNGWVFGVELPRLVLNEAYAQIDNDNSDAQIHAQLPQHKYAKLPYRMNVWVELHNPLPNETNAAQHAHSNPNAELVVNGAPAYEVVLAPPGQFTAAGQLTNPANVTGDPAFAGAATYSTSNTWGVGGVTNTVFPANGDYNTTSSANTGFYVLGAQPPAGYDDAVDNPNIPGATLAQGMSAPLPINNPEVLEGGPMPGVAIVLRRLACPHLPLQTNATKPNYNPYVTTDVMELVSQQVNDSRRYLYSATPPATDLVNNPPAMSLRNSYGRLQPYAAVSVPSGVPIAPAAASSATGARIAGQTVTITTATAHNFVVGQYVVVAGVTVSRYNGTFLITSVPSGTTFTYALHSVPFTGLVHSGGGTATVLPLVQQSLTHLTPPQPPNTFYQQNHQATAQPVSIPAGDTLKTSFDWLAHLDRQLISPMELINVAGVKPHELTHYFQMNCTQNSSDNPSKHLVPWTDQTATSSSRLARFFEFATTANRYNGVAVGGRVPGKININTLGANDKEVFRAAVDVQPGNAFFYPAFSIASAKEAAKTVTIATNVAHNFILNQSVQISGVGQPAPNTLTTGYNGTFTIKAVPSATTFTYTSPVTGLSPASGGVATPTVTNAILAAPKGASQAASHLVTIQTTSPHGFTPGQTVVISNVGVGEYNGTFTIASIGPGTNPTTFTVLNNANTTPALLPPSGGGCASVSDSTIVDTLFNSLIGQRTPTGVPSANDKPYMSLATGLSLGNDAASTLARGVDLTALRPLAVGGGWMNQRMIEAPNNPGPTGNTYQRYEMLNKIFNNLTVRSNVFAVWMTVGFFAVDNDTTTPVTLGAEIGHAENLHIRHRMLAIVDRTNLQEFPPIAVSNATLKGQNSATLDLNGPAGIITRKAKYRAITGTNPATNLTWQIRAGTLLTFDPNTSTEETVKVIAGAKANQLQVTITQSHQTVTVRGNPGPCPAYNPRSDTSVVPYFAIID